MSKYGEVSLLLPKSLASSFEPVLKNNFKIKVFISEYHTSLSPVALLWLNFWGDVLYLTFPNCNKRPNATAEFHRQHYRSASAFKQKTVVILSRLVSRLSWLLPAVVWLYQIALPKYSHTHLFQYQKPDLMIGCSFGLGIEDASFLKEASLNKVTSAVVVQSWDRTSNKGYPVIKPDHALVWNHIMAQECVDNLLFKSDVVNVVGSPLWDKHFNKLKSQPSLEWRDKLGIEKDTKVLFLHAEALEITQLI